MRKPRPGSTPSLPLSCTPVPRRTAAAPGHALLWRAALVCLAALLPLAAPASEMMPIGDPFLLTRTEVQATISGPVAHVEVTQHWQNPNPFPVDGLYIFPLPENAAVNAMRLQIGRRVIRGILGGILR